MIDPLGMHGPEFLALYVVLFALAIAASIAIPRWLRADGRGGGRVTDPLELAWLGGGAARYAEALVAKKLADGSMTMAGRERMRIVGPPGERVTGAELALHGLPGDMTWISVAKALKPHAEQVGERLAARGLLIGKREALELRLWQTAPFVPLLVLGIAKWQVGTALHRPVGFLTMLLFATGIGALVRFLAVDRRTRAGLAAWRDARAANDRLRRAPRDTESGMAVALFGTAVLAGSPLSDFHQLRQTSSGGDSSGDGGGGGGCGGGGCGGCS